MSNPVFLIIDSERYHETSYDFDEIVEILSDIPGIHDLKKNPEELSVCADYDSDLGLAYAELGDGGKYLTVRDWDDHVALRLALEINERYTRRHGASLEASDAEYNFHVKLEGIETLEQVLKAIDQPPS